MSEPLTDPGYIFGGNTGLTSDELRRRRMAQQLMASYYTGGQRFPTTFGEGLAAIGEALGNRGREKRQNELFAKQEAADQAQSEREIAAIMQIGASRQPPPEAAAQQPTPQVAPAPTPDFPAQTPQDITAAIASRTNDPDKRAYLTALLMGESAGNPNAVSPTGARGLAQFTGRTGRAYGLVGPGFDRRGEVGPSIDGALALADDNARAFAAKVGRLPTNAETAAMHQQGAGAVISMVTGAGNASARNLQVNGIDPNATPTAALTAVEGKYPGMQAGTYSPRDRIAATQLASSGQIANDAAPPTARPTVQPVQTDIPVAPQQAAAEGPPQPPAPWSPKGDDPAVAQLRTLAYTTRNPNTRAAALAKLAEIKADTDKQDLITKSQYDAQMQIYLAKQKAYDERTSPEGQQKARLTGIQLQEAERKQQEGTPAVPPTPEQKMNDPNMGTPRSLQRSGMPDLPPTPAGLTQEQWRSQQAPILTQATEAVKTAENDFGKSFDLINQVRNHAGLKSGTGFGGGIARGTPGTSAYAFGQLIKTLQGKEFLQAYQSLKGGGQISNVEGEKAAAAIANLDPNMSKEDFTKALNNLEKIMRGDLETAQRRTNHPVTAWRGNGDNSSYAPDLGEVQDGMRYIGGNPGLQTSWSKVQ